MRYIIYTDVGGAGVEPERPYGRHLLFTRKGDVFSVIGGSFALEGPYNHTADDVFVKQSKGYKFYSIPETHPYFNFGLLHDIIPNISVTKKHAKKFHTIHALCGKAFYKYLNSI